MPSAAPLDVSLRECPGCGLVQTMPSLRRGTVARCPRCAQVLRRHRTDPMARSLALAISGVLFYLVATNLDFIDLDVHGRSNTTTLISGPVQLEQQGMGVVGLVVLATIFAAPLVRLVCLVWVLAGLRMAAPPLGLRPAFRWFVRLAPWSMVEVFLLGVFVAYTKLVDLAHVTVGAAVYALGALMLTQVAADATLDREAVWEAIARARRPAASRAGPAVARRGALLSCEVCTLVTARAARCLRCDARLERRKPSSVTRTWALLLAAAVLYLPANVLPVMTYVSLGRGDPNTILSGVVELARSGMWPLALLVFFASITVPLLKLFGLGYLLITTQRGSHRHLARRTAIFRAVEAIGRWSMIDVFMISILTALVRMDQLASVYPGAGVVAFCAVVVLTMVAAMTFDPRVMWDAAGFNAPDAPAGRASDLAPSPAMAAAAAR